jgi:hypothetical protein
MDSLQKISDLSKQIVGSDEPFKMIFSKIRSNDVPYNQIIVKPVRLKDNKKLSCVFRSSTKDETKNIDTEMFETMSATWLQTYFYNLDILTQDKTIQCLQSKKGKLSIIKKNVANKLAVDLAHDHHKKSFVNAEGPYYKDLGLISDGGLVFSKGQKKYNQVNKYIENIHHLLADAGERQTFRVADMGSGKAYLTFALNEYLTAEKGWKTLVTGYESRPDLTDTCNNIVQKHHIKGLHFVTANISQAPSEPVDMVVALHACDIATDMAIAYGIQNHAEYIVLAPCCQKQIRKSMSGDHVLSPVIKHGILEERLAEMLTDGMRALFLQAKGYQTKVFEFISLEHTQKNVMITAKKGKPDPKAMIQFEEIKKTFGIEYHYLEKLFEK